MVLAGMVFGTMVPAVKLWDGISLFLLSVMPTVRVAGGDLLRGPYADKTEDALGPTNEVRNRNWAILLSCIAAPRSHSIYEAEARGGSAPENVGSCCYAQAWFCTNANSRFRELTEASFSRYDRTGDVDSSHSRVRIRAIVHELDELWKKWSCH